MGVYISSKVAKRSIFAERLLQGVLIQNFVFLDASSEEELSALLKH